MTTTAAAAIDEQNPWPGLRPFDEAAERFFNGRRNESAELRRLVLHAPLTVLFGASGLGKTSLVQAGLFPLLRREHLLPVYVRLDVRDRGAPLIDQVKFALQAQIHAHCIDAPAFHGDESPWQYLHRAGLELWSEQNQLLTPVFVFDQFEEVFTLGTENPAAIARLRIDLADLIENRMPAALAGNEEPAGAEMALDSQRYKVVLSFREDFLPAMEGWKRQLPSILRNRLRLLPMSGEQAFEAVHTTAAHLLDEPLARRIVRFVAAAQDEGASGIHEVSESVKELEVEPALLSLVCTGLNEKRKAQRKAVFDEALLSGTGQAIIADYYAEAVADLPVRVQRFIENQLITERGFRKSCDVDDARSVHGVADRELRLLVDRRVLRIEPQRATEQVELTHDLLTRVVREHRDRQRERERMRRQRRRMGIFAGIGLVLAGLAVVFGLLYRSAEQAKQAADVEKAGAIYQRILTDDALEKMKKEKRRANTEAARATQSAAAEKVQRVEAEEQRQRAEAAASDAERNTRIATAQRLAAQAEGSLARNPQRSIVLAVEAVQTSLRRHEPVLPAAEQSLRQSLAAVGQRTFGHAGAPVASVAISPEGRWLALGGARGVYLSELTAAGQTRPMVLAPETDIPHDLQTFATRVVFSRDGRRLVSRLVTLTSAVEPEAGKPPQVWDLSGKIPVMSALSLPAGLGRIRFTTISLDGRWLLGGAEGDTLVVWDLAPIERNLNPIVLGPGTPLQILDAGERSIPPGPSGRPGVGADARSLIHDALGPAPRFALQAADPVRHKFFIAGGGLPTVSPDGRWLVAVAEDQTIHLSDLTVSAPSSGSRVLQQGVPHGVRHEAPEITFSSDSNWLVIASSDGTAQVWNLATRDLQAAATVQAGSGGRRSQAEFAISPTGQWLVSRTTGEDPYLRNTSAWLWNLRMPDQARKPSELIGHESGVSAADFTPDGRWAVTGSLGGVVRLWDLTRADPGISPVVLRGHEGPITALSSSADGRWLVTQDGGMTARVWDLQAPQQAVTPLTFPDRASWTEAPAISPDSRWLVTRSNGVGRLWDLRAQNPTAAPVVLQPDPAKEPHLSSSGPSKAMFSPDAHWLVNAAPSEPSELFDLTALDIQKTLHTLDKGGGPITALEISPDSRWLVMSREQTTREARLWDLKRQRSNLEPFVLRGHDQAITEVVISGDSRWAATASSDATVRLWSLTAKDPSALPQVLRGHAKRISACRFSGDSRWLLTASDDGMVQAWKLTARAPAGRPLLLGGHTAAVSIATSPDGRWLVTSDHDATRLWDLRLPRPEASSRSLPGHAGAAREIRFSPDSRWLLTVDGGLAARLWDMRAGNPAARPLLLRRYERGEDYSLLAMSQDSHWLATGGPGDRVVRLWNMMHPDPAAAPVVLLHEGSVSSLAISPDSRWLITGSQDRTVRLWDLGAENPAATPPVLAGVGMPFERLLVSPDSRWLVSGGGNDPTRLWHLRVADLIALARDAAGRNLSPDEWELFFQGQPYRKTFPDLPRPQK